MALDIRLSKLLFTSWILLSSLSQAFYIPGYSIRTYSEDENVPLLVNKVYSDNSPLTYAYYDLPFVCPPTGHRHHDSGLASGRSIPLNLGEVLRGDRIVNSDMEVNMGQDVDCQFLCERTVGRAELAQAQELVEGGFLVEWVLDNLPGATSFVTVDRSRKYYAAGFKLGYQDFDGVTGKPQYYLNNHFTIIVRWRPAPDSARESGKRVIIGFEVFTKSINVGQGNATECAIKLHDELEPLPLYLAPNRTETAERPSDLSYFPEDEIDMDDGATMTIPYTYSVYFRESHEVEWANRWDLYFSDQQDNSFTHWLAIINSIIISGVLGAVCIVIWGRTMGGDIRAKGDGLLEGGKKKLKGGILDKLAEKIIETTPEEDDISVDELPEDLTGWKLLHGDVFRPPPYGGLLAPLIGSGLQLVFMVAGLLTLSCFGVLNPSWRGGFVSVGVGLFVLAGGFSGYFSARVYKTFGGQNWRKNAMMTALLFPGLLFGLIFFLNLFTWAQASSTALPFSTLLAIVSLWLLIQLPLVHLGSYLGFCYRSSVWQHPTRTNTIPRQIPPQAWYTKNQILLGLSAGLIPFAVLFIELLFVFRSLYLDKSSYYYVFGFLSIISALLTITIAETVLITTYLQLCAENYHWWWQSFFTGAASGVWIFAYSVWYYFTTLHIHGLVAGFLFFGYSALACAVYGLAAGTVGWCTAYLFVRRIFGGVKID